MLGEEGRCIAYGDWLCLGWIQGGVCQAAVGNRDTTNVLLAQKAEWKDNYFSKPSCKTAWSSSVHLSACSWWLDLKKNTGKVGLDGAWQDENLWGNTKRCNCFLEVDTGAVTEEEEALKNNVMQEYVDVYILIVNACRFSVMMASRFIRRLMLTGLIAGQQVCHTRYSCVPGCSAWEAREILINWTSCYNQKGLLELCVKLSTEMIRNSKCLVPLVSAVVHRVCVV